MQRAILIVLSFGVFATMAPAQPTPTDEVFVQPTLGERGSPFGMNGAPGRERRIDPRQTQKIVERWKTSQDTAEREKLEAELRGQLKREFAARLAVHEREIKQLEEKVRQLRERLALRKEKQDDIVDHRLQQILRDAQGLGWGAEGVHGNAIYQYWQATDAASPASDDLFAPAADNDAPAGAEGADDVFDSEAPSPDSALAPKRF
jgi:hypothetical protein